MGVGCTEKLVAALIEAGAELELLERAKADHFHDYKAESATPCVDLVGALRRAGLEELAKRAMNGEFDATKEESDEWAASPDGQATFRLLHK